MLVSPLLSVVLLLFPIISTTVSFQLGDKVIYAINAGGPAHEDVYGVQYQGDTLEQGVASEYGMQYNIHRVPQDDAILYQTERYTVDNMFTYNIPLKGDGDYVLVLKFAEVYFQKANKKVFNVAINNLQITSGLDIFELVGFATALDVPVPFKITGRGKKLKIFDQETIVKDGKIQLHFVKGAADNPKVNAFYVIKGTVNDVPSLPPLQQPGGENENEDEFRFEDEEGDDDNMEFSESDVGFEHQRQRPWTTGDRSIVSGRPHLDPWEFKGNMEKWAPVGVAIASGLVAFTMVSSILKMF